MKIIFLCLLALAFFSLSLSLPHSELKVRNFELWKNLIFKTFQEVLTQQFIITQFIIIQWLFITLFITTTTIITTKKIPSFCSLKSYKKIMWHSFLTSSSWINSFWNFIVVSIPWTYANISNEAWRPMIDLVFVTVSL